MQYMLLHDNVNLVIHLNKRNRIYVENYASTIHSFEVRVGGKCFDGEISIKLNNFSTYLVKKDEIPLLIW